jgi:hypothetical protein
MTNSSICKSTFVSIASFQLFGNVAKLSETDTEPFLTFIKDDDDIDSLRRRIGLMTGEADEEWGKYRLAFIKDHKFPFFLPNDDESSVWELLESTFPNYVTTISSVKSGTYTLSDPRTPVIGIQRKFNSGGSTTRYVFDCVI